jgi:hypothetical protein
MALSRKVKVVIIAVLTATAVILLIVTGAFRRKPLKLRGAVIRRDADPRKGLPVADARIVVANRPPANTGTTDLSSLFDLGSKQSDIAEAISDASGFFTITLPKDVRRGRAITFALSHADYPLTTINDYVGDKIYILRMDPGRTEEHRGRQQQPESTLGHVLVRYSAKATTLANIGSAARTFEVVNQANQPCDGKGPCSPDRKWKAAVGSLSLDAGAGNEFQSARASCIAGPCPFTSLDDSGLARGGQVISVSARNWADTAVFLIEAEVVHPMVSDTTRESHPIVLGRTMSFTIPPTAEGVSIQAEVDGETIVFPLGPALILSWADCTARVDTDKTKVYRCVLKPGFRFN